MTKRTILILTALIVATCLLPTVAFAETDSSSTSTSSDSTDSTQSDNTRSSSVITQARQRASEQVTSESSRATEIENKASSTAVTVREQVCEQNRSRLQTATKTMYEGATSVKTSLDTAYQRLVSFYDSGKLTVTNYQQYIDAIELAKQEATTSMAALQTRENADINCTDAKTATRLEGDRLAGESVRTQLDAYRTALVNLVSALKSAAATTTGSAQ